MATKKKVASKTTQKAAPVKKAVAKAPAAKKPAKPAPAKKAAPAPKKAAAKKAAPAKAAPKAAAKPAAGKAVVAKSTAKKAAPVAPKPAVKKASAIQNTKLTSVKNVAVPAKSTVKKEPAVKQQVVTKSVSAEKEKPFISKSEEKELKTMAVKKADTKVEVAKEKDSSKKAAEKPVVKAEKSVKTERSEKPEKTEKTDKKGGKATLVTYQPEFTKSVLDQPAPPTGPVYRYSDSDLQEFRELIQKKLESAKKELIYLQGLITRKDEAGTDDTENKYMSMEDGSGSQEREQLNQMASRQIQFIDHLEKAMMRIENKTYGICRVTGKLIDKARLRAVPHATLSIEAKLAKSK